VIWGLRTHIRSDTGFSPFFLVYGSKAVLPTDVAFGAPRIQFYEEGEAEQTRRIDLDSLEEQRLTTVMRQAHHDQQLLRYHDRNIRETSFNVGYYVLRCIQKTDDMHKLPTPWERPFIVTEVINPLLTVKIRQPSHEFTFGIGISFIHYLFVLVGVEYGPDTNQ
jgi:hypothetical protein